MARTEMPGSTLDAPVRELLERIAAPAALEVPDMAAIGDALLDFARRRAYLDPWIARLGETSGLLRLHAPERGPRLALAHRLDGQMGAIHDHGTWVALAPVTGLETHRRYRRPGIANAVPVVEEALEVSPREVVTLTPPGDIHDHGHVLGRGVPAYVLILAGDDQTRFGRTEWDLATGRHRILRPGVGGRWIASEPMPAD
ncbi:MAG: hypothetical protein ABIR11_08030 [Candidatus Limnocylindrales bacterium]